MSKYPCPICETPVEADPWDGDLHRPLACPGRKKWIELVADQKRDGEWEYYFVKAI